MNTTDTNARPSAPELGDAKRATSTRPAGNIIEVKDVTVQFDGFKALDGLSFSLAYGELRFLIGPNGAGKTTLLDILTGKSRASKGQVLFDGHVDVQRWPEHKLVQHGIGRKFQTPTIF